MTINYLGLVNGMIAYTLHGTVLHNKLGAIIYNMLTLDFGLIKKPIHVPYTLMENCPAQCRCSGLEAVPTLAQHGIITEITLTKFGMLLNLSQTLDT